MSEHYHFVQHFLRPGDYVQTEFTCTAPVGAQCRMHCITCYAEEREVCECEYRDPSRTPNLQDYGSCIVIPWLAEDAPEESYNGDSQPVRGPEPQPILEEWTGDNYQWDYTA
jgi:hypothetical protein